MNEPLITVVIPTYNRAGLLRGAITSVLDQTFSNFLLLVSDNASTDGTRALVEGLEDPRIRYYRQPSNIGMLGNFRTAIYGVQTPLVAVLSDDDLYLPSHLQNAVAALGAYPQAAYYACPAQFFGDRTEGALRPLGISDTTSALVYCPPASAVNFLGIDTAGVFHGVFRRAAFHNDIYWGPPGFIPSDMLLLVQLMVQGGFVFGNQATTCFRIHQSSISSGLQGRRHTLRFNCMVWYAIRWLATFLLAQEICTAAEIEHHGLTAVSEQHVVPLVLALGSFDSPPVLSDVARRVFAQRRDMDAQSARFRLARRLGFWSIPVSEKITQATTGWRP